MVLFFYSVAVVAVLFAMYWSQRAWGLWAALVVALIGGISIRFVPMPFGTLLAAAGSVPVILAARLHIYKRQGGPPPGDWVPGAPADDGKEPHENGSAPGR